MQNVDTVKIKKKKQSLFLKKVLVTEQSVDCSVFLTLVHIIGLETFVKSYKNHLCLKNVRRLSLTKCGTSVKKKDKSVDLDGNK